MNSAFIEKSYAKGVNVLAKSFLGGNIHNGMTNFFFINDKKPKPESVYVRNPTFGFRDAGKNYLGTKKILSCARVVYTKS